MRTRHFLALGFLLAAVVWFSGLQAAPFKAPAGAAAQPPGPAQPQATAKPPAVTKPAVTAKATAATPGEDAVRQAIKSYVAAINAGDFKAVAAFWTADGDYADPAGNLFHARKVIGEELIKRFTGPDRPKLAVDVTQVRMVTPDVAVEDGRADVTPAGGGPPARGHYTAVWVKQQGKWLISNLRESMPIRASHRERLAELDWLVGTWQGDSDGATVRVKTHWTAAETYLIRDIEISRDGKSVHSVSQRIGWDPLTRRLKGWTFEADGSHAETFWTKVGDDWLAQSTGVTRDGRTTTARNLYHEIDDDGFTLEATETQVGAEVRPDFKIRFTRQATEE